MSRREGLVRRSTLGPDAEGSDVVAFSESELKTSPSEGLEDRERMAEDLPNYFFAGWKVSSFEG